jgi:hypothetical protein
MKLCIIGPGAMEIPPKGWGAVEILIHDIRCQLENLGHEVVIVNTRDKQEIIRQANAANVDFVHVHYDEHIDVVPYLTCDNITITSHYGYLDQFHRWDDGYKKLAVQFLNSPVNIFALSSSIANVYCRIGVDFSRLQVVHNGVREDLFRFDSDCLHEDRSLYLAKIDFRKRQHTFQSVPNIYFAGNLADPRFNATSSRYLGEWSKEYLYDNLTNYANLVLLSDGEAHPLVCLEALVAGLGIVISEFSTANLDLSLPFIDVIPESRIMDLDHIAHVLRENRERSVGMREEIREYGLTFAWSKVVKDVYLPAVERVMSKR